MTMPRFRQPPVLAIVPPPGPETLRLLIDDLMAPAHFFLAESVRLEWEHRETEEISWEMFQGRLLDPGYTRQKAVFESWNIYRITSEGRSGEPLLSVKVDEAGRWLYVVRGLECYAWEGYDSGGGVILSRERRKWVRELTGTVDLARFDATEELADELI